MPCEISIDGEAYDAEVHPCEVIYDIIRMFVYGSQTAWDIDWTAEFIKVFEARIFEINICITSSTAPIIRAISQSSQKFDIWIYLADDHDLTTQIIGLPNLAYLDLSGSGWEGIQLRFNPTLPEINVMAHILREPGVYKAMTDHQFDKITIVEPMGRADVDIFGEVMAGQHKLNRLVISVEPGREDIIALIPNTVAYLKTRGYDRMAIFHALIIHDLPLIEWMTFEYGPIDLQKATAGKMICELVGEVDMDILTIVWKSIYSIHTSGC